MNHHVLLETIWLVVSPAGVISNSKPLKFVRYIATDVECDCIVVQMTTHVGVMVFTRKKPVDKHSKF
jgi:hypothetical protein